MTDKQTQDSLRDEAPEALFSHCQSVYQAMLERATKRTGEESGETVVMIVYRGMLTQLVTGQLHLSVPYYSMVTRSLKQMGCIRQLKRGGGTAPSEWELIKEPTVALFEASREKKIRKPDRYSQLQGQFDALNKRVLAIEKFLERTEG